MKLSKGFVLFCASGWRTLPKQGDNTCEETTGAVGPVLVDGFKTVPTVNGADVFYKNVKMFAVNKTGCALLNKANGVMSLSAIIEHTKMEENAPGVGMFYVCMGMAGYLKNRVEIELYQQPVTVTGGRGL